MSPPPFINRSLCTGNFNFVVGFMKTEQTLELRQCKNNWTESATMFVLKLPRFFTRLYGEEKSAAISKLTYIK